MPVSHPFGGKLTVIAWTREHAIFADRKMHDVAKVMDHIPSEMNIKLLFFADFAK